MSINTLETITEGDRTISRVKITDETQPRGARDTWKSWEFHCEACDQFDTELTEAEARDELENHSCPEKKCWACGRTKDECMSVQGLCGRFNDPKNH